MARMPEIVVPVRIDLVDRSLFAQGLALGAVFGLAAGCIVGAALVAWALT